MRTAVRHVGHPLRSSVAVGQPLPMRPKSSRCCVNCSPAGNRRPLPRQSWLNESGRRPHTCAPIWCRFWPLSRGV